MNQVKLHPNITLSSLSCFKKNGYSQEYVKYIIQDKTYQEKKLFMAYVLGRECF